jgi:lipoprotein-anchoring transpeptidase ErfK/SrfK
MLRLGIAGLIILLGAGAACAQPWGPPYYRGSYYRPQPPGYFSFWGWDDYGYRRRGLGPSLQSGGERPEIAPLEPQKISFRSTFPVNSVVIDTKGRQLFFVLSESEALYYPISVGREGFTWTGTEAISRKANWPDWFPPEEMRERDWRLPEKMTGGIKNPLGAKALYLGNSLYRIHGTNDVKSIGQAASSGCFRMLNGHIVDLSNRVEIGTVVNVVSRLPPELAKTVSEQVHPKQSDNKQAKRS